MALPDLARVSVAGMDARWAAAIGDLYQACQLRPPGVLFARNEAHLAKLTRRMTATSVPLSTLHFVMLAILLVSAAMALHPGSADVGAFLSADFGLGMVPFSTILLTPPVPGSSVTVRRAAMRLVTITAAGLIVALLSDRYMAAAALALTGAVFMASDLVAPVRDRRAACASAIGPCRPGIRALSRGFRPVGDVVHERLRSALSDLGGDAVNRQPGMPIRDEPQRRMWQAMRDELHRLHLPDNASPVLGRTVGADYDQAARVSELGLFGTDPAALPRVLQAAVTLDGLAAAICALDGIAIVLPLAAPDTLTAVPAASGGWRRSRRAPWRTALSLLDEPEAEFVLAIDLAPRDSIADRLLARRIMAIDDPARRAPVLEAMGVARVAAVLRLRPVHTDTFGRLFHFGDRRFPIVYVAVRDYAVEADGTAIEHWICVPPHMATAREAVAWTFGMNEQAYRPVRET